MEIYMVEPEAMHQTFGIELVNFNPGIVPIVKRVVFVKEAGEIPKKDIEELGFFLQGCSDDWMYLEALKTNREREDSKIQTIQNIIEFIQNEHIKILSWK